MQFIYGGENGEFRVKLYQFGLYKENEKFADYLQSDECRTLLQRNKMSIHIHNPGDYDLINVPKSIIPDAIQTNKEISLLFL